MQIAQDYECMAKVGRNTLTSNASLVCRTQLIARSSSVAPPPARRTSLQKTVGTIMKAKVVCMPALPLPTSPSLVATPFAMQVVQGHMRGPTLTY